MDFESTLLDMLEGVGNFDFNILIRSFLASLVVIWFFIAVWVWIDSGERTRNILFRIFSVLLVAPFNVVGLIIYLILRPKETIENVYWGDLERRYLLYETSELGDCPQCGDQLSPGFNICPSCSYELKVKCKGCEMMLDRKWNFCPYCKEKVLHPLPEEEGISKEVIRQRVEQSRQEIRFKVEQEGTRYKTATGVTVRLGNIVMHGVMSLGKAVNDFVVNIVASIKPSKSDRKDNSIKDKNSSETEEQKLPETIIDEESGDFTEKISELTDEELEKEMADIEEVIDEVLQDESDNEDTVERVESDLEDMISDMEDEASTEVGDVTDEDMVSDSVDQVDESIDAGESREDGILDNEDMEDSGTDSLTNDDEVGGLDMKDINTAGSDETVEVSKEQITSGDRNSAQVDRSTRSKNSKKNKKKRKKKKRSK